MTLLDLALLLGLATLWGGSYFFIRIAVPAFGPAALVALRVVIGGLLLWAFARARRQHIALRPHLPRLAILGLLNAALPYLLISAAELHLTASFAAILGATVPLFAAALGARLLDERLSVIRVGGLLMGVVGVAVIVGWGPMSLDRTTLLAVVAMLAASASYAGAGIYTKLRLHGVPTYTLALGQQLGAFVWLAVPGALLTAAHRAASCRRRRAARARCALHCRRVPALLPFDWSALVRRRPRRSLTSFPSSASSAVRSCCESHSRQACWPASDSCLPVCCW